MCTRPTTIAADQVFSGGKVQLSDYRGIRGTIKYQFEFEPPGKQCNGAEFNFQLTARHHPLFCSSLLVSLHPVAALVGDLSSSSSVGSRSFPTGRLNYSSSFACTSIIRGGEISKFFLLFVRDKTKTAEREGVVFVRSVASCRR